MKDSGDALAEMVAWALLLFAGVLVALAWITIKAGIDWIDQQALLQEAQGIFDRVRAEDWPDLQIDPLLRSIFGEDLDLPQAGASDSGDWLIRAVFETV